MSGRKAGSQAILGDWSLVQPEKNVITVIDCLRTFSPSTHYDYQDLGWNLHELSDEQIKEAAQRAKAANLAILVVGENSMRYHW